MTWVGWQRGSRGEQVKLIQAKLLTKFQWVRDTYPALTASGEYDKSTEDAVREFQRRAGLPVTGIANYATQLRLGVVQRPPKMTKKLTIFTVAGTGADWMVGYPADVARAMDPAVYQWQPVSYPSVALPMAPSAKAGEAELVRLMGLAELPQDFVLVGYSQGAMCTSRVYRRLTEGDLRHWGPRLKAMVCFGNPLREGGHTFPGGRDPGGHGLDPHRLKNTAAFVHDYAEPGDIYTCASGTDDAQANDNMTAIYNLVQGEGIGALIGKGSLAEQLLELVDADRPLEDVMAMFRAISSGIGFIAGQPPTAPHVEYHWREAAPGVTYLQHAINYLQAVGRRAQQAA